MYAVEVDTTAQLGLMKRHEIRTNHKFIHPEMSVATDNWNRIVS